MGTVTGEAKGRTRQNVLRVILAMLVPFLLIACQPGGPGRSPVTLLLAAKAAELGLVVPQTPSPLPEVSFSDANGKRLRLADFRGKVLVVNVWGTWCPPCRDEMPSLDRLQQQLGGSDFEVLALSIDREGMSAVAPFYAQTGLRHLKPFLDLAANSMKPLGIRSVPATLIVDRRGNEIGRFVGVKEWDAPALVSLLREAVAATARQP